MNSLINNKELINENKVNNDKNNLNLNDKININIVNESMSFEKLNPNDKDKKISINNNIILFKQSSKCFKSIKIMIF